MFSAIPNLNQSSSTQQKSQRRSDRIPKESFKAGITSAHRFADPPATLARSHAPQRTATKERVTSFEKCITYHAPSPEGKPSPNPITQDEADEIAPTAIPWHQKFPRVNYISPPTAGIDAAALHQFMGNAFLNEMKRTTTSYHPLGPEEVANGVVRPVTKEIITKYKTLINDPLLRNVWSKAMCKELGRLCQGYSNTEGTQCNF